MSSSSTCCIPWLQRRSGENKDKAITHPVQPISSASDEVSQVDSTEAQAEAFEIDSHPNVQSLEVGQAQEATPLTSSTLADPSSPRAGSSSSSASSSSSSSSSSSDSDEEVVLESNARVSEKVKPPTQQASSFPPVAACFPLSRSWPIYDISEGWEKREVELEPLSSGSSNSNSDSDSDNEIMLDRTAYGAMQGEPSKLETLPTADVFSTTQTWPIPNLSEIDDHHELHGMEVKRSCQSGDTDKEEARESASLQHDPCGQRSMEQLVKRSLDTSAWAQARDRDLSISTTTNSMISTNCTTTNSMISTNHNENLDAAAAAAPAEDNRTASSNTLVEPNMPVETLDFDQEIDVYTRLAKVKNKMQSLRQQLSSEIIDEHSQNDQIPEAQPLSSEDIARNNIFVPPSRIEAKAKLTTRWGPRRMVSKPVPTASPISARPLASPSVYGGRPTGRPMTPITSKRSKTPVSKRVAATKGPPTPKVSTRLVPCSPPDQFREAATRSFPLQSKTMVQKPNLPESTSGSTSPLKVVCRSFPTAPSSSSSTTISPVLMSSVFQAPHQTNFRHSFGQ